MSMHKTHWLFKPAAWATTAALLTAGPALAAAPVAGTALGAEFRVNTTTTGDQLSPRAAMSAIGDSVVVWVGPDASGNGIYAQRYAADGSKAGDEFAVNTNTTGEQSRPEVAMDATGDFVVVWQGPDASGTGVFAQRYAANGAAQGSEFQVNDYNLNNQDRPDVAMDALGNFLVVWQSFGQDDVSASEGVYGQLFNANGSLDGGEFRLNTTVSGNQSAPSLAMDADGDFVVAWESVGSANGMFAQRYHDGAAQGGEFQVNTTNTFETRNVRVAMSKTGAFVIVWVDGEATADTGPGDDVYAQLYAANGNAVGGQFKVNTTLTDDQQNPDVSMDAAGNFTVAWESNNQDGGGFGVYAQRYNAAGVAVGSEFRVNTTTTSDQGSPGIARDATGGESMTWLSAAQDGSGYGIYAQRFAGSRSVDLAADMSVSPSGIVMPGTRLTLTAHVSNATPASATGDAGQAAVEDGESSVRGATLKITLPQGSVLETNDAGCAAPVNNVVDCSFPVILVPGQTSDNYVLVVDAPTAGGGLVLYTDQASSDATDPNPDNDLGATGVFLIGPIASDMLLAVNRNTAKGGNLVAVDMDGDTLSFAKASAPKHGSVSVTGTGHFTYTPAAGYTGTDSFTFLASEGSFSSNLGTVSVTVTEHAPVAKATSFSMTRNTSHSGTLSASDVDKGDKLIFSKASNPFHGSVTISAGGGFTYTPKANYHGADSFKFKVSDGTQSSTATVTIKVN